MSTRSEFQSGGVLLTWARQYGVTFSRAIDEGAIYRRLPYSRRVPLGAIVAQAKGREWYFREAESAADRAARTLFQGLALVVGL